MPKPSTREKLLDAGLDRLHAQGFNGCSVQDITEAAGVPKGSFFNHFSSKEALALEALSLYGAGSRVDLLFDKGKAPLARLREHFEYLAAGYERWEFERGCLLGNFGAEMSAAHPLMREALKGGFEAWCGAVAGALRDAQDEGTLDPHRNPDVLARFLVNAWEGIAMRLKVVKNRQPIEEFFEVCFGKLLK